MVKLLGKISLVAGIVSFAIFLISKSLIAYSPFFIAVIGVLLGIKGIKRAKEDKLEKILSIIGIILGALFIVLIGILFAMNPAAVIIG
jgi:hypothetical protein